MSDPLESNGLISQRETLTPEEVLKRLAVIAKETSVPFANIAGPELSHITWYAWPRALLVAVLEKMPRKVQLSSVTKITRELSLYNVTLEPAAILNQIRSSGSPQAYAESLENEKFWKDAIRPARIAILDLARRVAKNIEITS